MQESEYAVKTTRDLEKLKAFDVVSAELVEIQKVLLLDYHEVDSVPLLIFEKISDNNMVSHWIYENMEDSVHTNKKKLTKSDLKVPVWIAIWHLQRKAEAQIVVGQIMRSLNELVPLAIDDPPFSHLWKDE